MRGRVGLRRVGAVIEIDLGDNGRRGTGRRERHHQAPKEDAISILGCFSLTWFGTLIALTYDDYYLLTNPLDFLTNLANQISLTQLDSLKLGLDQPTSW